MKQTPKGVIDDHEANFAIVFAAMGVSVCGCCSVQHWRRWGGGQGRGGGGGRAGEEVGEGRGREGWAS